MAQFDPFPSGLLPALRDAVRLPESFSRHFLAPESEAAARVAAALDAAPYDAAEVSAQARELAAAARTRAGEKVSMDTFLREYSLGSEEGVLLMCLAEALIRIPDDDTARLLVEDKLSEADFGGHLGHSESLLVNASTWGLLLTGRLFRPESGAGLQRRLRELVNRLGENVALRAIRQAMTLVGEQFVVSESIGEALARAEHESEALRWSFDMLGEAAVSDRDAETYCASYLEAIEAVGALGGEARLAVSIKLSALDGRYEPQQRRRSLARLEPRLRRLVEAARTLDVQLTVDAEEAWRLHLSLELFETLYRDPLTRGWGGLGLAVQAYQKRALDLIDWLAGLAAEVGDRIPVRLVKGAYWDAEIKRAQLLGLEEYPVFVHKAATDCSWLACADRLLACSGALYGQFASHNAHSLTALLALARGRGVGAGDFEIQRLYGMGAALSEILAERWPQLPQRIYAPVGAHRALLPYLMRRLLENGANSSFVHHLSDPGVPLEALVRDPRAQLPEGEARPRGIPLPRRLYAPDRLNSRGLNLDDERRLEGLVRAVGGHCPREVLVQPLIGGRERDGVEPRPLRCPAALDLELGSVRYADEGACSLALDAAAAAFDAWRLTPVETRAACLERMAELLEENRERLMALAVFEAGKTLSAALGEVREAADFCRYYAMLARRQLASQLLPGPTGEENRLWLEGRGPVLAISPWNFPLAIFTGQAAAALVCGNSVIAKPSEHTPLIALEAVRLFHRAGVPPAVLNYVPARGEVTALALIPDPRLAGIAFTGSTRTARAIARTLAAREGRFVPFIAETGGQNCMIVDSSALPEQVVRDVLVSAFDSGGQRCSALRVLYMQEEIADELLEMLKGAVELLSVGHPLDPATDVGPVISAAARESIRRRLAALGSTHGAHCLAAVPSRGFSMDPESGYYVVPTVFELEGLSPPEEEVFGPLLHVMRFRADQLELVLEAVRSSGYALTGGVHSRIERRVEAIEARLPLGNLYVNRNIIGAVVGTQPFGGFGLSGTGPKAGGPHYLTPFCHERVTTTNTAAVGGDATLLAGSDLDNQLNNK